MLLQFRDRDFHARAQSRFCGLRRRYFHVYERVLDEGHLKAHQVARFVPVPNDPVSDPPESEGLEPSLALLAMQNAGFTLGLRTVSLPRAAHLAEERPRLLVSEAVAIVPDGNREHPKLAAVHIYVHSSGVRVEGVPDELAYRLYRRGIRQLP